MVQGNCAAKGNGKGNHGGGSRRPSSHRSRKCNLNRNGSNQQRRPQQQAANKQDTIREEDEDEQYEPFPQIDKKHQQIILNVFRDTFSDVLFSDTFTSTLQAVKQALYEREFAKAFGDAEHLAVYATRWSPTRALCYSSILSGLRQHLDSVIVEEEVKAEITPETQDETKTTTDETKEEDALASQTANLTLSSQKTVPKLNILSIGGGPAELVALGSFLNQQTPITPNLSSSITLLDSAPYTPLITSLHTSLISTPPISKYASAAAKAANVPLLSPASRISSKFIQQDALELGPQGIVSALGEKKDVPTLVTLLFTLNELFTSSGIGATTRFLLDMTTSLSLGSLLLVVDSPGSYSETTLGKESKKYPMAWLLDRVLLAADPKTGKPTAVVEGKKWKKLETRKSSWFRLAEGRNGEAGLDYPIALENMRYQLHLYRLVGEEEVDSEEEGGESDEE
ncbi:hypothetical protein B0T20DRAFT_400155 [Sordaria brevicollis]|uniref:25S rRNA (Uridine(2843)-N(3))-methyltransferase n=1 Tax=Sordaria brevicollis TaxID=83679 RepID=A0AAE0UGQ0_SORBR|nr:hypothetical protein B0T20DRAFT_400155 [Sordaria brevicollis]